MSALKTSSKVAKSASSALKDGRVSGKTKTLAGSALSQTRSSKTSSEALARSAAKVLANPRSSKTAKQIAASVLSQKKQPFPVKIYRVVGSSLTQKQGALVVRKVAKKAAK